MHARPSATDVSVLSQIAHASRCPGFGYYAVQGLTFAILVLAANTSYQGFPRLAALLARDRFFPRQFVNLGDRLVYSNGIVVLTGAAAGLVVLFRANVNSLIHLYVIGVFTAFTLSQAGMVRYWRRRREPAWRRSAAVNAARRRRDRARPCDCRLDEVPAGRLGGHRRSAAARARVLRHPPPLRPGRPAAPGRRVRSRGGTARHERGARSRARARPGDARGNSGSRRAIAGDQLQGVHVQGSARPGRDPRGSWWDVSRSLAARAARGPRGVRARAGVEAAPRRVAVRHRRAAGAVPPTLAAPRDRAHRVPTEGTAVERAERRHR